MTFEKTKKKEQEEKTIVEAFEVLDNLALGLPDLEDFEEDLESLEDLEALEAF